MIKQLDRVLELQAEKMAALQTIRTAETRTLGRKQVAVTDADKKAMILKTLQHYNRRIADIYRAINQTTQMENPFEGKDEKHGSTINTEDQ